MEKLQTREWEGKETKFRGTR